MLKYGSFHAMKRIPTRAGMTLNYGLPLVALLVGALPYLFSPNAFQGIVLACLSVHFVKRLLESWFLHKYSGPMNPLTAASIAGFYSLTTFIPAYINRQPVSGVDLLVYAGVGVFLAGETLNFVHHKILANLRTGTEYVIPRGGLFEVVACPHYLFEIVSWFGMCLIVGHVSMVVLFSLMLAYLIVRSLLTLAWYRERFPEFPAERRAILPFIL
jgi:protein-S-isoprenylcysteine O-methyltransferase Ste14